MVTIEFLRFAAMLIIFGALWRTATVKLADKPVGKAMAYVYG